MSFNLLQPFFFCCWSIVDLQSCVNFYGTAKWFSYTYIYILFYILFQYSLSQDIEYSSLCYTVGPCYTVGFIHYTYNSLRLLIPHSQTIPPPHPSPLATTCVVSMLQSFFLMFDLTHPCPVREPPSWLLRPVDKWKFKMTQAHQVHRLPPTWNQVSR